MGGTRTLRRNERRSARLSLPDRQYLRTTPGQTAPPENSAPPPERHVPQRSYQREERRLPRAVGPHQQRQRRQPRRLLLAAEAPVILQRDAVHFSSVAPCANPRLTLPIPRPIMPAPRTSAQPPRKAIPAHDPVQLTSVPAVASRRNRPAHRPVRADHGPVLFRRGHLRRGHLQPVRPRVPTGPRLPGRRRR